MNKRHVRNCDECGAVLDYAGPGPPLDDTSKARAARKLVGYVLARYECPKCYNKFVYEEAP